VRNLVAPLDLALTAFESRGKISRELMTKLSNSRRVYRNCLLITVVSFALLIVFGGLPAMIVVFGGVALSGVHATGGSRNEFEKMYLDAAESLGVTSEEAKAEFEHWYGLSSFVDSLMIPRS
jgi:hypothetical protein